MIARKFRKYLPLTVMLFLLTGPALLAQTDNSYGNSEQDKGATASELISGSSTSISGMVKFDTNLGWNFTKHFGVDLGVPYLLNTRPGIFAGTSGRIGYVNYPYVDCTYFFGCYYGEATSARIWTGELADVYAEAHYARTYRKYDFLTNLTGDAPTASFRKGLTSGRAQWDWFNHIDTSVHGFGPFVNFGLANGRMDQHFLPRPYDTNLPFKTLGWRPRAVPRRRRRRRPSTTNRPRSSMDWAFPPASCPAERACCRLRPPDIFYAEDRDGDGKADYREVLFTGFGQGNQQHRLNGFELGLDGWIYGANGDSGGDVRSMNTQRRTSHQGRDFRFRPETGRVRGRERPDPVRPASRRLGPLVRQ